MSDNIQDLIGTIITSHSNPKITAIVRGWAPVHPCGTDVYPQSEGDTGWLLLELSTGSLQYWRWDMVERNFILPTPTPQS